MPSQSAFLGSVGLVASELKLSPEMYPPGYDLAGLGVTNVRRGALLSMSVVVAGQLSFPNNPCRSSLTSAMPPHRSSTSTPSTRISPSSTLRMHVIVVRELGSFEKLRVTRASALTNNETRQRHSVGKKQCPACPGIPAS